MAGPEETPRYLMKSEQIMDLLREAATPQCSNERRIEIQIELERASPSWNANGIPTLDARAEGILIVFERLYVQTLAHKPELLPIFYPVFSIICGDRPEHLMISDIDWSLR